MCVGCWTSQSSSYNRSIFTTLDILKIELPSCWTMIIEKTIEPMNNSRLVDIMACSKRDIMKYNNKKQNSSHTLGLVEYLKKFHGHGKWK